MRCSVSSHHGIPLSVIQEKILTAKSMDQDIKLNAGLQANSNSIIIQMTFMRRRNAR